MGAQIGKYVIEYMVTDAHGNSNDCDNQNCDAAAIEAGLSAKELHFWNVDALKWCSGGKRKCNAQYTDTNPDTAGARLEQCEAHGHREGRPAPRARPLAAWRPARPREPRPVDAGLAHIDIHDGAASVRQQRVVLRCGSVRGCGRRHAGPVAPQTGRSRVCAGLKSLGGWIDFALLPGAWGEHPPRHKLVYHSSSYEVYM